MQNQIPNNWQQVRLGEVVDITSSKRIFAREYLKEGIPFYRSKEIIEKFNGNKISFDLFISQKKYDEIKVKFGVPQAGDMLLTSVGTLGVPYLVNQEEKFYFKDGNLTWFRNHNGIDSAFLFYWIRSSVGKEQLMKHTIGSSQQALTIDGLKNIDIYLPKIEEQKLITKTLSAFDDKIELNNKIAKTLEDMASEIFKEWFIKFHFPGWEKTEFVDSELGRIPNGWKTGKLGDLVSLDRGISYNGAGLTKKGIPMINLGCFLRGGLFSFENLKYYSGHYQEHHLVKKGDIVIANTDITQNREIIGNPALISEFQDHKEFLFTHHIYALRNNSNYSNYYFYFLLRTPNFRGRAAGFATGTNVLSLPKDTLSKLIMTLPPAYLVKEFSDIVKSNISLISNIELENQKLAKMRDLLLPKLMKGEIRV